jgi:hypothetical protein
MANPAFFCLNAISRLNALAYPLKDVKLDFLCTVYIIIKFTLDMLYITNWQTADVAAAGESTGGLKSQVATLLSAKKSYMQNKTTYLT